MLSKVAVPAGTGADGFVHFRRMFDLTGRIALITGGNRGIGSAIACALAAYGASIVLHHFSGAADSERMVAKIAAASARSGPVALAADLSRPGEGLQLARAAAEVFGRVDILIANAAVEVEQSILDVGREEFDRQINVNLRSTLELIQSLGPQMSERGWGRIVTIGSVQQVSPNPQKAIYAASKAAQASLALSVAKHYAPRGVTVNNLAPGLVATDRNAAFLSRPGVARAKSASIPLGRIGVADDVAGAALLLCSNAGGYITGQNLFIDGGLSTAGGRK